VDRVAVVGAGPIGLTAALELAALGIPSVVLEAKPQLEATGSRAIVLAHDALATFRRVGCEEIPRKVVRLRLARTYLGETELFTRELPPELPDGLPAVANLQQTFTERALLRRAAETGLVDVRFDAAVTGLRRHNASVTLELDGDNVTAGYVIGADGAHSTVRKSLGVDFPGESFHDRFLIADIRAELPFPRDERRFYFNPPSNPGRQILIHPQPDGQWRIDWQVPPETDPEAGLDDRIRALVGDTSYELVWLSAYRFHSRLATRFRVGRVFLAGDAAHLMAPFGARGMNSGVEDATAAAQAIATGDFDAYERERRPVAIENLRITGATMRFMAPPTPLHRLWRNAILRGSLHVPPLRRFVNSGKLPTPRDLPTRARDQAG
jgi:2-polyprenyl-6-methoxyphenol hydroxylase-like FAD-dependent oxidoreductase